ARTGILSVELGFDPPAGWKGVSAWRPSIERTPAPTEAGSDGGVTAEVNSPLGVDTRANATPKAPASWDTVPVTEMKVWFVSTLVTVRPWERSQAARASLRVRGGRYLASISAWGILSPECTLLVSSPRWGILSE